MRESVVIKEKRLPSILSLYPSSLFALAFCICSLFLTYLTYHSLRQSQHEGDHRYQAYLLATQLQRSSDQLTLMARSYAVTGEMKFLQLYTEFLDVQASKKFQTNHSHRVYFDMLKSDSAPIATQEKKSFQKIVEELNLPENEIALLQQVKNSSIELSALELQAFSEVENGLMNENYALSEGRIRAISLLYSKRYILENENINRSTNDFFDLQTPRSIHAIESNTYTHYILATLTTLSFLILIAFLLYNLYKQSKNKQVFVKALRKEVSNRTLELFEKREQLKVVIHEMEQTKNQLVEAEKMASLGNLVSGVAHEVNTPLGISVTLGSHLQEETKSLLKNVESGKLKKSDLDTYCAECIENCALLISNLDRAANLISSFKQVAVDQSSDEIRTFKVSEYANEVLLSLHPAIKKTDIKITVNSPSDEPMLKTYPGAIAQIVTNLVMNAIVHAFDNGKQSGKVDFSLTMKGPDMIMQVIDDGKGMTSEVAGKIFDPFYTTQRGNGGSGLGMSIVYNLVVHQLLGSIECKSILGEGSTFLIRFPMQVES